MSNNKPSNFQQSVDRARAKDAGTPAETESSAPLVPMPKGVTAMLMKPTTDDINAIMNDGNLEFAPQVHSLEEGELIIGILEGRGPSTTFTQEDPYTKQPVTREVSTWIIAAPNGGLRLSILSSVQLERKLPPCIGALVKIYRGKEKKTQKGFRVTDYMVGVERRPDGKSRSWIEQKVIDAESRVVDAPTPSAMLAQGASGAPADEDVVA